MYQYIFALGCHLLEQLCVVMRITGLVTAERELGGRREIADVTVRVAREKGEGAGESDP